MLYKLNFLMTTIRKTTLQVAYFQVFTNLTTELYTSNDRFGFIDAAKLQIRQNLVVFHIKAKGSTQQNHHLFGFLANL